MTNKRILTHNVTGRKLITTIEPHPKFECVLKNKFIPILKMETKPTKFYPFTYVVLPLMCLLIFFTYWFIGTPIVISSIREQTANWRTPHDLLFWIVAFIIFVLLILLIVCTKTKRCKTNPVNNQKRSRYSIVCEKKQSGDTESAIGDYDKQQIKLSELPKQKYIAVPQQDDVQVQNNRPTDLKIERCQTILQRQSSVITTPEELISDNNEEKIDKLNFLVRTPLPSQSSQPQTPLSPREEFFKDLLFGSERNSRLASTCFPMPMTPEKKTEEEESVVEYIEKKTEDEESVAEYFIANVKPKEIEMSEAFIVVEDICPSKSETAEEWMLDTTSCILNVIKGSNDGDDDVFASTL